MKTSSYSAWVLSVTLGLLPGCKGDGEPSKAEPAAEPKPKPKPEPVPGAWDETVAGRCDDAHRSMLAEHLREIVAAKRAPGVVRAFAVPTIRGEVVPPNEDALVSWNENLTKVPDPGSVTKTKMYWANGKVETALHLPTVIAALRHVPRPALAVAADQPASSVAEALEAMKEAGIEKIDVVFSTVDGVVPPAYPQVLAEIEAAYTRARQEPGPSSTTIGERVVPLRYETSGAFAHRDSIIEGIRDAAGTCEAIPKVFTALVGVPPAKRDEQMATRMTAAVLDCGCALDEPALVTYLYLLFVQRSRWTTRPAVLDPTAATTLAPGQRWGEVARAWAESGRDALWLVGPPQ